MSIDYLDFDANFDDFAELFEQFIDYTTTSGDESNSITNPSPRDSSASINDINNTTSSTNSSTINVIASESSSTVNTNTTNVTTKATKKRGQSSIAINNNKHLKNTGNTNTSDELTFKRFKEENNQILSDRVTYLLKFPQLYQEALNSGDSNKLVLLFTDCCTPNFTFQPPSLGEVVGAEGTANYFFSLFCSMPDLVFSHTPTKRFKRVISCKVHTDGTMCNMDDSVNPFKSPLSDPLLTRELHDKYAELKATGQPIYLRSTHAMHLILNVEMTHIEKIIHYRRGIDISLPILDNAV